MSEDFDEKLAATFVGKHLLIGITHTDSEGDVIEQTQVHGRIQRITPSEGVVIRRSDSGDEYKLPPDLSSFQVAPAGEYRLRATGEVVNDPDLLCTWVVKKTRR